MKLFNCIAIVLACGVCVSEQQAMAQTVPFYVDNTSSSAVIPTCFNGTCATTVPESWAITAMVQVQYPGTLTVNMDGEAAQLYRARAYVTIDPISTVLLTTTPTLLSSASGAPPFTIYFDPVTGNKWLDQAMTIPVPTDVYGNPIDPSTATFNPDGTVATAGTAYVSCPSCANLEFVPPYQMPCISDGATVEAVDCASDPNTYYGPPITAWLHNCAVVSTTNQDGSVTEQFQDCVLTYRDPDTQMSQTTYQSPAYTAGPPLLDAGGNPVTLACVNVKNTIGTYQSCSWSGPVEPGVFFLKGAGTSKRCGISGCANGGTMVSFPVTVPAAPPPPPPPPPACPPNCGDD